MRQSGSSRNVAHAETRPQPSCTRGRGTGRGRRALTCLGRVRTLPRFSATREVPGSRQEITHDETYLPAEPAPSREDAWLPGAHENEGRAEGAQATACEGTQAAGGLSGRLPRHERLTRSADFQALFQQGKRIDRSSLIVLWRPSDAERRAGFAVSRHVGGAVKRNRVRRRLREAYRRARASAPEKVWLVIVGRAGALTLDFNNLVAELQDALGAIPRTVERTT